MEAVFDGEITDEDELRDILYSISDFYRDCRFIYLGDRLASYLYNICPDIPRSMGHAAHLPIRHNVDIAEVMKETRKRCEETFPGKVADVILYGSYASRIRDSESDVNIMLLLDVSEKLWPLTRYPVYRIASELSLKYDVTITITGRTLRHWEENKDSLPFYQRILREGRQYVDVITEQT